MKVSDIIRRVEPLSPVDTIGQALYLMHSNNVDIVPVVGLRNRPVAAVTQADIQRALQRGIPLQVPIRDHLSISAGRVALDTEVERIPGGTAIPSLVVGKEGTVLGVVTLADYAAALKSAVKEFRRQIYSIMDSAESGIIAIDESGTIVTANRKAEELFGLEPGSFIGRNVLETIPNTRLMDVMKSGKPLTGQKFEGTDISFMANYAPVVRDGIVVGAVSVFQDISLLEEISNELGVVKGLNRELGAIIHSSYDGIWITDGEGCVLDINEAYERITGIKAREVIGRTMQELVDEGYFNQSVTLVVMQELRSVTINQTVKGKKQILVTGNPIFDENGKLFRVVTNVRDVSELASLQEQLCHEKARALKYKAELTHLRSMQIRSAELIFRSSAMAQVVDLAIKMADVDSTLLITGESGTGKEVIAKLVHRQGKGDASPFIGINCAAIPEQLLESELFGYEGGSFTGAKKEGKPGLFELAHKGTLFLDEVAELPLPLQVKILRVIQDRHITRVGGTIAKPVNVRIIAATHQNLSKMIKEGSFREDLYYRLMVVPINVPPLRNRKEDIPLLVRHFLDEFNRHFGYGKAISPQVLDKLMNYAWPGNVRELRNVIERMIVMSQGNEIVLNDLPGFIHVRQAFHRHGARLRDAVIETETHLLSDTFKECGSWQKTAKILGVDRATIFRKASKYGLLNK